MFILLKRGFGGMGEEAIFGVKVRVGTSLFFHTISLPRFSSKLLSDSWKIVLFFPCGGRNI